MDRQLVFNKALALREEGRYKEACEIFLALASHTDNLFEKTAMMLNLTHTLKMSGSTDLAKKQLNVVRELLLPLTGDVLGNEDDENRRRLIIWAELEDARILASENKLLESIVKLKGILSSHESELSKVPFEDLSQEVQRDLAFLLVDTGSCEEALPILQELDSKDPHYRWTTFYLGYCYSALGRFLEAIEKLEESIQLGLTPDFEGRAHCALGASSYELNDYPRAKAELEKGVETASPRYIKEAGILHWLENTCISLGLKAEAEHYGKLARYS